MNSHRLILVVGVFVAFATANALPGQASPDSDYIARALSAAPPAVASGAAVVRMEEDGSLTTLRKGSNGFTCLAFHPSVPMCADANSMEFMQAVMKQVPPPNKVGIAYMLQGDAPGGSNTDQYATSKTADNHWVVNGPHIMVFGPPAKTLGYPATKDPDTTKPYMMWAGTPYEHAMIPVALPQ